MPEKAIKEQSHALYACKQELEKTLTEAVEPPPLPHPEMANFYREQVLQLHEALHDDSDPLRLRAAEAIRSLVDKIVLTPTADGEIDDRRLRSDRRHPARDDERGDSFAERERGRQ